MRPLTNSASAEGLQAPHLDFLRKMMQQYPRRSSAGGTRDSKSGQTPGLVTPLQFANYDILGVLGQGGMSVVYRARQRNLDRLVALKVLAKPEAETKELARFRAEARALAALHHRHIVPIYEVGEQDGQPYFTLELIEGSLAQRLRGQPQDPVAAAHLVDTLAGAIHYAHEQGIVHRDLKPGNILLQRGEGREERGENSNTTAGLDGYQLLSTDTTAKIADFGLAKYLHQSSARTQSGAVLGTPSYMAPEQALANAAAVGPAADIYALGAILYELLTGRPPFQGATPLATLSNLIHEEPVAPSWLVPGVPHDLATICLKCLEKEPARRYASARELADDLQRFLAHQPILARSSSALYRWGKFARRNRGAVGGVLGIVAALAAGTVVAVVLAFGERHARNSADRNATSALHEASRARMAAAVLAMAAYDYAEAGQDLDAVPSNLRDWEWRHLHSRLMDARPTITHLAPEYRPIEALLPIGRQLVARHATNGRPGLLDTRTGNLIRELPTGRLVGVGQTHTGVILIIAPPDAPLVLVDERGALEQTHMVMGLNPGPAAITADGGTVAVIGMPEAPASSVALRDRRTGALRRTLAGVGPLTQLVFSPDGALLAGVGVNLTVTLWDTFTGEAVGACRGHERAIKGVAFHGKEKLLLSWSDDGTVRQWRLPHGELATLMRGHNRPVYAAAYATLGDWIASCSEDGTVRLWRTGNGAEMAVLPAHDRTLDWLAVEPGDAALVTASQDGTLRRWPLWMLADPRILRGHTSYVYPVAFSPDGRWIASGGWDNVIRLWDAAAGEPIRVLHGPTGFVACLAASPDGKRLAARSMDGRLRIWDPASGDEMARLQGHTDYVFSLAFSPDGSTLVSGSGDTTVRMWDTMPLAQRRAAGRDVAPK